MTEVPSTIRELQTLNTQNKVAADPRFAPHLRNVLPLAGRFGNRRRTVRTLGEGSFGRVNLEEVNNGQVATKYFTSDETICDNATEIGVLHYLKGMPNVAQLIRVATKPAGAEAGAANLPFPAAVMGKAKSSLLDRSLYRSWNDLLSVVKQVLRGYYVLHSGGIVHRDTKPGNMLMSATGEVLITDFGMARYIDHNIPDPIDAYTGTRPYAAPELLMKSSLREYTPSNFFQSDCWAVGASLYEILTGRLAYRGNEKEEILDYIFAVKGIPKAGDGEVYDLFLEYKRKKRYTETHVQDPNAIKARILDRCVHKPADLTKLEQVAEIISGLMEYDPEKRMTIKQALQKPIMGGRLPDLPPSPSLISVSLRNVPLPAVINERMLDILMNWMNDVIHSSTYKFSTVSKPIIMDRAAVYIKEFMKVYKDSPFMKRENLQLVGCVALYLAGCFFDSGFNTEFDYDAIVYITDHAYDEDDIKTCMKMFMTGNIQFFGNTFFDVLLKVKGEVDEEELETYALLNFVSYQKSLFPKSLDKLPAFRDFLLEYVSDPAKIRKDTYISKRQLIGDTEKTKSFLKDFIAAAYARFPELVPAAPTVAVAAAPTVAVAAAPTVAVEPTVTNAAEPKRHWWQRKPKVTTNPKNFVRVVQPNLEETLANAAANANLIGGRKRKTRRAKKSKKASTRRRS
jgi:serine/threonine protein kinase